MDITPKSLFAGAAKFVVAIAMAWLVISPGWVAAQSTPEEADQATESTSMNTKRLGKLLKKHFPRELFLQNGPSVWIVQLKSDDEANPALEDVDEVDQLSAENVGPDKSGIHGKLLVITDERANRMRIMMPIQPFDAEKAEDLKTALFALHANYDRALDARYAISEGLLWSAFIHPLRSLTEDDLASALEQVQTLRKNTGTTYSSGAIIFAPAIEAAPDKEEEVDEEQKDRSV